MGLINYYHDPTIIDWNVDEIGNKVSVLIENEPIQIINGKTVLQGIPDVQYRVQIDNYTEINIRDKFTDDKQYKVNYTYGHIWFSPDVGDIQLNVDRYYSRGIWQIPASKVWYKINDASEVIETLEEAVEDILNQKEKDAFRVWEEYQPNKEYEIFNKVYYKGRSYINIKKCENIVPTNIEYWQIISDKGVQGEPGEGLDYDWDGTKLGIKNENEPSFKPSHYVNLKGDKGDTGNVNDLEDTHIINALGYTPADENDIPPEVEIVDNLTTTDNTKVLSAKQGNILNNKLNELEYSELSSIASNIDSEGIYKNAEWERTNGTLYAKSSLIGNYPYGKIKIDYYDEAGEEIIKTITWDLTYDDNNFPYTRTVI